MGMSGTYGPADDAQSVRTIQAALDSGVTLLDTGDFYGMGHNELLLRQALADGRRKKVVLSVKFGALRAPDGSWTGYDARPAAVKNFLAYTLKRLGTDFVDIYRPARVDPRVPIEDTVGAIADLITAGYVRHAGLSEASADTIGRAHAISPIVDVQLEYSLMSRGIEQDILPAIRSLGIPVTAYGVLSRGLLSGQMQTSSADIRTARFPRFQGENLAHNLVLADALGRVARSLGVTTAQAAIAWVLSRGPDIVPVIGSRTPERLEEALAATELALGPDAIARIEQAVPAEKVLGTRYEPHQMAHLDSERMTS
jgi:pyridoxine 4-dehydrogenase